MIKKIKKKMKRIKYIKMDTSNNTNTQTITKLEKEENRLKLIKRNIRKLSKLFGKSVKDTIIMVDDIFDLMGYIDDLLKILSKSIILKIEQNRRIKIIFLLLSILKRIETRNSKYNSKYNSNVYFDYNSNFVNELVEVIININDVFDVKRLNDFINVLDYIYDNCDENNYGEVCCKIEHDYISIYTPNDKVEYFIKFYPSKDVIEIHLNNYFKNIKNITVRCIDSKYYKESIEISIDRWKKCLSEWSEDENENS